MTDEQKYIPDEFARVIKDFIRDIKTTFPEYHPLINKWWKNEEDYNYIENVSDRNAAYEKSQQKSIKLLFDFSKKKFPPRFFDILYQNEDIFKVESDIDTEFLPSIHFKNLWQCEITDKTKETIWKYLQLITFSIVGTIDNKDAFGDTAKMFEAINEEEFKTKLEESLSQIQELFDLSSNFVEGLGNGINADNIPDANDLHNHITSMLDGKLGQLAREIAEEAASNLNVDFEDATDMKDVFQKLIKNPSKLMGLVKTVGDKLDTKIKSGDIKESELIAEATEMMNRMKNIPGMENIQSMLNKMGMGGLGKVNTGAMESRLNQQLKMAKTKERIRAKAEANAKIRAEREFALSQQPVTTTQQPQLNDEEILKLFNTGEKVERTPRGHNPQQNNNKKKKGKK